MRGYYYNKSAYYLKSIGTCFVVFGGCWFFYQVRQVANKLGSTVTTDVLNLEQAQAQYIYIDDPRYKDIFTFHDDSDLGSSVVDNHRGFKGVVNSWRKNFNRGLAFKLLSMAKHGTTNDRNKAAQTLSSLKHLKDWHYRQIAQMLDAKTAVTIARMPRVDQRFFLEPPYYRVQRKLYDSIENLHFMMTKLDKMCENGHPCLRQFINKKFHDVHRESTVYNHDLANVGVAVSPAIIWDKEFAKSCVQAIHHHSSIEKYERDIVEAGGLAALVDVQKIFHDDIEISILIAKIISNLSVHREYLEDIYRSGWIGILSSWSQNKDVRLAAPASRALANLDSDDNATATYSQRVCLLYPLEKTFSRPKVDVIFVHGLLGGVFVTWRQRDISEDASAFVESPEVYFTSDTLNAVIGDHPQEFLKDLARDLKNHEWKRVGHDFEIVLDDLPVNMNEDATGPFTCRGDAKCMEQAEHDRVERTQCWPRDWLPKDVPYLRILGINYNTNLSMWNPPCPLESARSTLNERSDEFVDKLRRSKVGEKPVIWICHSMGGLLVKKMLVEEWKNDDKNGLCRNTRAIIFYSTPHRGSHVAALKQTTQMVLWPSVEVQELRQESPALLRLHDDFLKMLKIFSMEIVSFSETRSTPITALKFPFQFVAPNSADPGVGEFFEIPQDHLTICKPANRHSFLYRKVLSVIERHVPVNKSSRDRFELLIAKFLTWPKKFF